MSHIVDFKQVSTTGLESSPVAEALAGLRANEARYFMILARLLLLRVCADLCPAATFHRHRTRHGWRPAGARLFQGGAAELSGLRPRQVPVLDRGAGG